MKIKPIKAMLIFMVILVAIILIGSYAPRGQAYITRTVTIKPGDNLWHYWDGKMNYSEWLYEMKQLNGEKAALLHSGDTIEVLEAVR